MYIMDKDYETLKMYEKIMGTLYPKEEIRFITHYSDLEQSVKEETPDIIILDGDSPYGIITAKKIKETNAKIKIVFSSSKEKTALDSYLNEINGYLKKPFTEETIKETIKNIK